MDAADEKWIKAILHEIQADIRDLKNFREKDANDFRIRLNLLEKQLAVLETQVKAGYMGSCNRYLALLPKLSLKITCKTSCYNQLNLKIMLRNCRWVRATLAAYRKLPIHTVEVHMRR